MATTFARMIQRAASATDWASTNPTLADGEMGWDSTNLRMKVGDGVNAWADLEFLAGASDGQVAGFVSDPGSDTNVAVVEVAGDAAGVQIADPSSAASAAVRAQISERNNLPSYVVNRSRNNRFDPTRGVYNFKHSNTRRLRAGLGKALRGGVSHHIGVGDSMMAGSVYGIAGVNPFTFDRPGAWPLAMRNRLGSLGVPWTGGLIRANDNALDPTPYGWSFSGSPAWTFSGKFVVYTTGLGIATYTVPPEYAGATAYTHLWADTGAGGGSFSFNISVNGAVSGPGFRTTTSIAGPARFRATTLLLAAPLNAGDTIQIGGGANGHYMIGGGTWNPATGGLRVHNLAQSGSRAYATGTGQSDRWASTGSNGLGSLLSTTLPGGNTMWTTRTVSDAVFVAADQTVTSATAAFTDDDLGKTISTPAGTSGQRLAMDRNVYITAINSATSVEVSTAPLLSATGVSLTIGQTPDVMHLSLGGNDLGNLVSEVNIASALTTIRGFLASSDCILYANPQPNAGSGIAAATYDSWVSSLYDLADNLDVPLVDMRARFGSHADWAGQGLAGDGLAHGNSFLFADWGLSTANLLVA